MLLDDVKPYLRIPMMRKPECQDGDSEHPVGSKNQSECHRTLAFMKPGPPATQTFTWRFCHVFASEQGTLSRAEEGF